MPNVTVTVCGPTGDQQIEVKAEGTLIGRQESCDIVLDSQQVSRRHARLYQDPFGRWWPIITATNRELAVCMRSFLSERALSHRRTSQKQAEPVLAQ